MKEVILAWYHSGYMDEGPKLLAVCATSDVADAVIEQHQHSRDKTLEYKHKATWGKETRAIVEGKA